MLHVSRPRPRLDEFGRALIAELVLAPGNTNNLTGSSSRGFEQGNLPSFLAKGKAHIGEEHRVLLVMLSHARHSVILTRAKSLIAKRGNP